jgi:large repetitive protein
MIKRSLAARVTRQLSESAIRSRRAIRRLATAGMTLVFLLNIVGPAVVLATQPRTLDDPNYSVAKNGTLTVGVLDGVLANDLDVFSALVVTTTPNGLLALAADGSFSYTPNENYVGADVFTYEACTDTESCLPEQATATITVIGTKPVAVADTATVPEDSVSYSIDAKGNDTDPNNDPLSYGTINQPTHGVVAQLGSGTSATLGYTPDANWFGSDSFEYSVTDGAETSDLATVSITVTSVNDAPSFVLGTGPTIDEDAGAQTAVGFLTDASPGPTDEILQTLSIGVSNDANILFSAQPVIDLETGTLTYTLAANKNGSAVVSVTVSDNGSTSNPGDDNTTTHVFTITITPVGDPPIAVADNYSTSEDVPLVVAAVDGLLANDSDADGATILVEDNTPATSGSLTLNPNGSFTFTPDANASGSSTFTYRISDGGAFSEYATVTITIGAVNDAPVAVADAYTVAEGGSLNVLLAQGLLANDTDVENSSLSAVWVTNPASGSLELSSNGSFSYVPNANFNGTDSFTYKAMDTIAGNTVTVTITVTPVNTFPVAIDGTASTSEDTPVVIDLGLSASDTETPDANLTYRLASSPTHGELTGSGQNRTYTPEANYSGSDTFTFDVTDRGDPDNCGTIIASVCVGTSSSTTKTITITIGAVNDVPVAVADTYTTNEDATLTVGLGTGLLVNDTDADTGTTLTAVIVDGVTHGTLTPNANGSFVYAPAANFNGSDAFTYRADDGTISGNTVTVTLNVTAVNDAPVAVNDSVAVVEDTTTNLTVLANDTDVDVDSLKVLFVGSATHGTASVPVGGLSIRYVPDPNYNGADAFDYTITDSHGGTSTATVTVNVSAVNDTPVCFIGDTTVDVNEDGSLPLAFSCTDVDTGTTIVYGIGTAPTHGTIGSLNPDAGTFNYLPSLDYAGSDSFTITGSDGGATSSPITISVTIAAVNDPPLAVTDTYRTAEDTTLTVDASLGVLANDSDVELNPMTASVVSNVSRGSLTFNANGSFTYVPTPNLNGPDSFTYRANDGTVVGNTVTVTLNVTAVNDAPTATDGTASTSEDTAVGINLANSSNDDETVGVQRTYNIVVGPAHGALTGSGNVRTYTPELHFNGTDTFTFSVTDRGDPDGCGTPIVLVCAAELTSTTQTITITIGAVNDAPVAAPDSYVTNEDATLAVDNGESGNILANDTDVENTNLTAILATNVDHGVLTLHADGTFTYVPTANYNGTDSFTYKANDGGLDSNIATVTITVIPLNDSPLATDGTASTAEDTAVGIDLTALAADTETSDANLTYTIVAGPTKGQLTGTGADLTYTPNTNTNDTDTFTFSVTDRGDPDRCGEPVATVCTAALTSPTRTITITVNAVNDAPVAVVDSYTTNEDTTLTVNSESGVLFNDTDVENNPLTAVLVSNVDHGVLTLHADGTFTYVPTLNFNSTDSFTYRANDGTNTETASGNVVTVTINVTPVNDAVIAVADDKTVTEDSPTTLDVLANDIDVDLDTLHVTLVGSASHGLAYIPAGGQSVRYIPDANFSGTDTFAYVVSDGHETTSSATVTLTVNPVNDAPVTVAEGYTVNEDSTLNVTLENGLLNNDTDVEPDTLHAVKVTDVHHGVLALDPDGTFSYTPAVNFSGTDTFTYLANDGTESDTSNGNVVTVTITVTAVNDTPVAVADEYTTNEDTALIGNVLTNDTDADLDTLHAVIAANVEYGTLTLNDDGSFSYLPSSNFSGTDGFTYQVNDGTDIEGMYGNVVTVTITIAAVNDAPVAVADSYTKSEDTTLVAYVLDNDTDAENDTLHVLFVGIADHGTAFIPVGGTLIHYVPDADYNGPDAFDYTVTDGHGGTSTATITVNVAAVNDIPTCSIDDTAVSMDEDAILALAFGCTDVDAETTISYGIGSAPSHGSITLLVVENGTFTYVPNPDYNGTDTFTIVGNDGEADSAPITITVTIRAINDAPVAVADTYSTDEDTTLNVSGESGNVLDNDSDVEISAALEGDGDVVGLTADLVTDVSDGTLVLASNGTFTYTPDADFNGTDSFTYRAFDGTETDTAYGNTVTVTLTVKPQNDAPVAIDGTASTNEDIAVGIDLGPSTADVETSDANLTYAIAVGPAHGALTGSGPNRTYTPNLDYSGSDTFTFSVTDRGDPDNCGEPIANVCTATTTSSTKTITITINAVNDAPVAVADAYATNEDTTLDVSGERGNVLDNDTDVDNSTRTAVLVTDVSDGVLAFNENGTFTYTPDLNFNGTDSFTYKANDGSVGSNIVTVTITVNPVQEAPVAVADTFSTNEDTTLTEGNVLTNDTDVEDNDLTAVLVTDVGHGTLVLDPDGTFSYAPNLNVNGTDSFTYKANDGTANGNTVAVTITVHPVNDAPVAIANAFTTNEDTAATGNVLINDTDIDLDTLTAVLVTDVANGNLTLNGDGSFSYVPTANFNGSDGFTYKANDGSLDSNIVAVTITITAVNDAPIAVTDAGTLAEGGLVHSFNVLGNDTDVEEDTLSLTATSVSSATGTVAMVGGEVAFTPAHLFSGNAAIAYTISDGHAGTDTGVLNVTVVPDAVAPVVSSLNVTLGAGAIVAKAPIRVSWAATDVGVGVARYEVQLSKDGGAFAAFYTGTATTRTALFNPSHWLQFRVRAVDAAGNASAYLTVGRRSALIVQSRGTGVIYRPGPWTYVKSSSGSGQGYRYSSRRGASVSYTFTGREVVWVAPKNSRSGLANVYIDGVRVATVNLRSATNRNGQQVFKKVFSASGRHTIKVVVAVSGRRVNLDAFVVLK